LVQAKIIPQYAGDSSLIEELKDSLAGRQGTEFRALVAYVSIQGLKMLETPLREFLKGNNKVDWIVGVDQGITSKDALEYLLQLKSEHSKKFKARIFTAGTDKFVFHPKLYWLRDSLGSDVFVGSGNMTNGGLFSNFEANVLLELKDSADDKRVLEQLEEAWRLYSTPEPPLGKDNLLELSEVTLSSISDKVAKKVRELRKGVATTGHPFASSSKAGALSRKMAAKRTALLGVRHEPVKQRPRKRVKSARRFKQLLMDILGESRGGTQVQIPTDALSPFFGIERTKRISVDLTEVSGGVAIRTDSRRFVQLKNNTHRLEMSGIKGLSRPLIVRIEKGRGNSYTYEVVTRSSVDFDRLDRLLETKGDKKRTGSRRWLLLPSRVSVFDSREPETEAA
jgi:HKD family nuclease